MTKRQLHCNYVKALLINSLKMVIDFKKAQHNKTIHYKVSNKKNYLKLFILLL